MSIDSTRNTRPGLIPSLAWMARYPKDWLRPDIVAGLTAAAVVMPKAMAYRHDRRLAGPGWPVHGVRADGGLRPAGHFAPAQCEHDDHDRDSGGGRNWDRRRPTAVPRSLLAAGATLAILVGAMLVLASVLRLGFVANFISEPVLTGFKSGIGLVIIVDQIPKLLGVHIEKAGFFRDILAIVHHLPADIRRHPGAGAGVARIDLRSGALRAARPGPAGRRCHRHRRFRDVGLARSGRGDGRQCTARPAGADLAAARFRRADVARRRPASR